MPGAGKCRERFLFRKGSFADAAEAYQQALKLGRDSLGIRVNIGLSLLNCGETAAAAEVFSSLAEEYPDSWEGLLLAGSGASKPGTTG